MPDTIHYARDTAMTMGGYMVTGPLDFMEGEAAGDVKRY